MPLTQEERERLITPENTAYLVSLLHEGETEADIPEEAYLIVESMRNPPEVTANDIEWGNRVFKDYMNRKYGRLAEHQRNGQDLL